MIGVWLGGKSDEKSENGWCTVLGKEYCLRVDSSNVVMNQLDCMLLTIADMTDKQKIEKSLEQASRLGMVGRIATQIAHEIGNPMTLISSKIQRLTVGGDDVAVDELRPMLSHIDRISDLIRRLSELGRESPLRVNAECVSNLLDGLLSLMRGSEAFDKITIDCEVEDSLPLVKIDRNKIYQVLLNLMLNAADSCSENGSIRIWARKVSLCVDVEGRSAGSRFVAVSVRDDGSGMSEEVRRRIFEPFFTTKESGKGTGLGLSVSLSIVNQHGGWMDAESKEGVGSEFTVYLPAVSGTGRFEIRQLQKTVQERAVFMDR